MIFGIGIGSGINKEYLLTMIGGKYDRALAESHYIAAATFKV